MLARPSRVIPGLLRRGGHPDGTFWAMPDNGFGTVDSSADFLLRIYLVMPRWERAGGGRGTIQVLRHTTLSDPHKKIDFRS
jgi:glycerophosphoryl diester phosphodiesterase